MKILATSGLLFLPSLLLAAPTAEQIEFFESRIRPVLAQDCYECHSSTGKRKSGLVLDHRDGLLKGGDLGPAVVPGKPEESILMEAIRHENDLTMPKAGVMLDAAIVADFEKWIAMGAPDPRDNPPTETELAVDTAWPAVLERRKAWWSFQPIANPEIPGESGHPVDRFIRAKLAAAGLEPSEPAESRTLARRIYFALIGLPPTPEQIDEFLNSGANVEALVEQLLASEQFGERWARHWMDWIRYAESHGSEGDPRIENAWLYRDYLIRSLNADVPFDQLVREHVAGDLLENPRINEELGINESLIATAHWRMVFHGFAPTDALDEKVRFVDDQINVFSKAFLGLTVSCARCHDHKFDAISQADYYALFGIFGSTRPGRSPIDLPEALDKNRAELAALKPKIREAIAKDWLAAAPEIGEQLIKLKEIPGHFRAWKDREAQEPQKFAQHWDLADPEDAAEWFGGPDEPSKAGEFAIATEGDQALIGIYPAGVFSHPLSAKHGMRFASPDFEAEGESDLWVRVLGNGDSAVRYVVQNYPRNGTVFPVTTLKIDEKNRGWRWQKFNLNYWDGDSIHIELTTGKDAPLLTKGDGRGSWFGIREAVLIKSGETTPVENRKPHLDPILEAAAAESPDSIEALNELQLKVLNESIAAWKNGTLTDPQAELLAHWLDAGILPNKLGSAKALIEEYRRLEAGIPIATRIPTLAEWEAHDQPLFDRGDHKKPLADVPRRFLDAIDSTPYETNLSGRLELADDLLRDDNPFTRRVIVNRIWNHLFGTGLVSTPDNLGRLGEAPSHPELLDHLATRFVAEDGWSIKELIRFIVTSETWRQSSQPGELVGTKDPENRLLSHFSVRRLEAEAIRDSILAVSGNLSPDVYGPPTNGGSNRRSVYVEVIRNRLDPFLTTFGAPEPFSATGSRPVTNVPAQSLTMMNNNFVVSAANRFAARVKTETDDDARIERLWLTALGRQPSESENEGALDLLEDLRKRYGSVQTEQARVGAAIGQLGSEENSIIDPIRSRLLAEAEAAAEKDDKPAAAGPTPFAFWDFEDGLEDQIGSLHGKAIGTARIEDGTLVVDGKGMVVTTPIGKELKTKTLEVLVQLNDLNQRAGGAITVQTVDGVTFDSIVFSERRAKRWMPGSNGFRRTEDFQATDETEAADAPVRITIAYDKDGTIRGYRNGQPYGKPIRKSGLQTYAGSNTQVAFGIRHGTGPGGGRTLNGRIFEAKLYDRALEPDEIAAAAGATGATGVFVSQRQVLAALTEQQKVRLSEIDSEVDALKAEREKLGKPAGEDQVWNDLAHSILNLKEFIYVR
ncbi:MAG: hypothetical protein ACI8UO_000868 [Verrucomicrobiales bacterium]|jgi:hypothetical protein